MKLSELMNELLVDVPPDQDREVRSITFNSKEVTPGDAFIAICGETADGHDYIPEAVKAGAVAVIGERELSVKQESVPYLRVPNARLALALSASKLFRDASRSPIVIGITGTNGKTTTAHMIHHLIEKADRSCSLFGTVECRMNGVAIPSAMTTHDSVQLHRWLSESRDEHVVMEVSSHGLAQHRVDGIRFDYGLFTNLTHEHLDYHRTMEHYFETKMRMFSLLKDGAEGIVTTNGTWGRRLLEDLRQKGMSVHSVGNGLDDTMQIVDLEQSSKPRILVRFEGRVRSFRLPLPGTYNAYNALQALLLAVRMGVPYEQAVEGLTSFPGVSGRFQTFPHPEGGVAVVDYAHTPDGLRQCLEAVRALKPSRIVHIFGFRGGKDDSKWDGMVKTSKSLSDRTILTFDDRNGMPKTDLLAWYSRYANAQDVVEDRTLAISLIWDSMGPGDWMVITGKGPERYKETFRLPSDSDIETLRLLSNKSEFGHFHGELESV